LRITRWPSQFTTPRSAAKIKHHVYGRNYREVLAGQIAKAGVNPRVVIEATYGWYWAVDTLLAAGAEVHLAHPLGVKGFAYRRVKNDVRDASDLADLLRMDRLPEAWIAPPAVRELRELVRHRHKLVRMASAVKAQVHAVLGKNGVPVVVSDLFGVAGSKQLKTLPLPEVYRARVDSQLRVLDALETEINQFDKTIHNRLRDDHGYRLIQRLDGIGPILAAVFVAELGDVTRFADPNRVCSWTGLTPRHRESDTTVHRGAITKQGSRLVRWAAIEAVQHLPKGSPLRATYDRIIERRGVKARNIAKVAVARKLLTLVYYGLRDGEIRCLNQRAA
jgi:Transposase and inactivated derivatives